MSKFLVAEAVMYSPGATLDPSCAPTDSSCGVEPSVSVTSGSTIPSGSTLFTSATGTWSHLPIGLDGQVLKVSGSSIIWGSGSSSSAQYFASGEGIALATSTGIFSIALDGNSLSKSISGLKISSSYIGQTSINTLGTISTGTWNGSVISSAYGGTGTTSPSSNQLLIGNSTGDGWIQIATSSLGLTSSNILEGINLYFRDERARGALQSIAAGLSYSTTTGTFSTESGYAIPSVASSSNWQTAYLWGNHSIAGYASSSSLSSYLTISAWNSTTTDSLAEGITNKYFSNSLARNSFSASSSGLNYSSTTGILSFASGYSLPLAGSSVGQFLSWDGNKWSTSSNISYTTSTGILTLTGLNSVNATTTDLYVSNVSNLGTSTIANLTVSGTSTLGGVTSTNLYVSGVSNLSTSSIVSLTVLGTSTLSGISGSSLYVTGVSSLSTTTISNLSVSGTFTLSDVSGSSLNITGISNLSTSSIASLTVTGTSTLASITGSNITMTGLSSFSTTTATGLTVSQNGLTISSSTPASTSNTLYNLAGTLMWNGSAVGSASSGLQYLNGLSSSTQLFASSDAGSDFSITSLGDTHTFSIPNAGSLARGLVSTSTQTFSGNKTFSGVSNFATSTFSNLTVSGTSTLGGVTSTNLYVSGVSNLSTSSIVSLTVLGTSTLSGISGSSLYVTGVSSLSTTTISNLSVSGTFTLSDVSGSSLNITGISNLSTSSIASLTVTGTSTLASITGTNITMTGLSSLSTSTIANLTVSGTSTLGGVTSTNLYVSGVSSLSTSSIASLTVTGTSTLASITGSNITMTGLSSFSTTTATGLTVSQNGLTIASSTPASTSNTLYNLAGTLMWNGSAVGGASLSGGQYGYLSYWTGAGSISTSTIYYSTSTGNIGIGITAPTAVLHLKAGTSATGTSPLKFTSGTNLSVPEAGSFEFDGTNLYFTATSTREILTTKSYTDTKLGLTAISDTNGISGFVDGGNINVSYDYTNRTVTLSGNLDYYWKGIKYTLASPWTSGAHNNTNATWFLSSSDGTNFTWSTTPWDLSEIQVALVSRKSTTEMSFVVRETHGTMDTKSHEELHSQIGTYRYSGGQLTASTYTVNTASDAANSPAFDAAVIKDEDNPTNIPAWAEGTYTTMYIGASSTAVFSTTSTLPFTAAGSYILVNNPITGAMSAGVNSRYYNVYQIMIPTGTDSNSQKFRTVMLQPQASFTSLSAATGEDARNLDLGNLSQLSNEFIIYSRITYVTSGTDSNTGKVRIATGGVTYILGNRSGQVSVSGFTSNNHGILSNLTWLTSGHIGNVNTIPAFDVSGNATELSMTGTGAVVLNTSPTFLTSITSPQLIGGTSTTQSLTLQTTSGVGASGSDMHFLVGNNGATEAMTILNSGYIGVGTSSPQYMLSMGTGGGYYNQSTGAWINGSDRAYKKDILDLSRYGLGTINALRPVSYTVKESGIKQVGFIAQELKEIIPELVSGEDGSMGVNYSGLTPILTKAIQEQSNLIFGTSSNSLALTASTFSSGLVPAISSARVDIDYIKNIVNPENGISLIWSQDISKIIDFNNIINSKAGSTITSSYTPITIGQILNLLNSSILSTNNKLDLLSKEVEGLETKNDSNAIRSSLSLSTSDIDILKNISASTTAELNLLKDSLSLQLFNSTSTINDASSFSFTIKLYDWLISWLGSTKNGLVKIFSDSVETKSINTQEICVSDDAGGKTCISKEQLDILLKNINVTSPRPDTQQLKAEVIESTSTTIIIESTSTKANVCDLPFVLNEEGTTCVIVAPNCNLPQILNVDKSSCILPESICIENQVYDESTEKCINQPSGSEG